MKLTFATIHVTDLEKSIEFYERIIGMKVARRFPAGPSQEIAFLRGDGGAEVELIAHSDQEAINHDSHLTLGFAVDSLDRTMEEIESKGVKIESGPFEPTPGTRFFFLEDPSGVTVQIIEQN